MKTKFKKGDLVYMQKIGMYSGKHYDELGIIFDYYKKSGWHYLDIGLPYKIIVGSHDLTLIQRGAFK